jgi:hypothetical protein
MYFAASQSAAEEALTQAAMNVHLHGCFARNPSRSTWILDRALSGPLVCCLYMHNFLWELCSVRRSPDDLQERRYRPLASVRPSPR